MFNRGSFSFVAMLVINPVVILFYQNCSLAPISHANSPAPTAPSISRQVASSEAKPVTADIKPQCDDSETECHKTE